MVKSEEDNNKITEPTSNDVNEESIILIEADSALGNQIDVVEEVEVVTTERVTTENQDSVEKLELVQKLLRNKEISLKKTKSKAKLATDIDKKLSLIQQLAANKKGVIESDDLSKYIPISSDAPEKKVTKNTKKASSNSDLVFCKECNKFLKRASYEGHKSYVHKRIKPHLCQTCGYRAITASILRQHIQAVHVGYTFLCDECPMKFNLLKRLRRHKKYKHSKEPFTPEKRHICQYCGHRFEKKFHLTNHIRKHTNETPFRCEFCDKKFKHKWSAVQHLKLHAKVESENCKS